MKRFLNILVFAVVILIVFWLGRQFGGGTVREEVISNSLIVKEIAELSSLEVQGNASIKSSNVQNDGGWSENLKKLFLENTVWVTIPYLAKYGVDVNEKNFRLAVTGKIITVMLPAPRLLSYELKMDKMETSNRKGLFLSQYDETYTEVQKKLYQNSRNQLAANTVYLQQSKDKIRKIITEYYQPFLKDHQLEVTFTGESLKNVD